MRMDNCCDCSLPPGMYTIKADVGWPGFSPFPGAWNGSGADWGQPCYLKATWSASAVSGASRTFAVTLDPKNGTLTSGDITGFGGTVADIDVAALFGTLRTSGTPVSATEATYDDGDGNSASLTLETAFTLGDLRDLVHGLLGAVGFESCPTDDIISCVYDGLAFVTRGVIPTLFTPATDTYEWGWDAAGGLISGSPPSGLGHVTPAIVITPGIPALFQAESTYVQYVHWQMLKTLVVNPTSCPVHMRDDFTAGNPGPPSETTPQFPTLTCVTPGNLFVLPTGIIDIAAKTTEGDYSAIRMFDHY